MKAKKTKHQKTKPAKPKAKPRRRVVSHDEDPPHPGSGTRGTKIEKPAKTTPTDAAYARWLAGEHLSVLAAELSVKRGALRRAFRKLAGGVDAFKALRAGGAGGEAMLFGGKRAEGGVVIDDSKVPRLKGRASRMLFKDGWKLDTIYVEHVPEDVFVSPKGQRYVRAKTMERADLIAEPDPKGAGVPLRLRQLETSSVHKAAKRSEARAERGEKLHVAKRAAKRARKLSKKRASAR